MPVIESAFKPSAFLRNGHIQTLLPILWPRRANMHFERERMELSDGDFLDLDWLRTDHKRLAILSHGLEGSTQSGYIHGMAETLRNTGWDVLAWNFRGCSGEPNRLLHSYHSGESGDLGLVVQHAAACYSSIALIGFSLGGNVTLKYLGEAPPHPAVKAAVAVSTPVDLATSARTLDERLSNRIYLRRFLRALAAKIEEKARRFPSLIDATGVRAIRSFREFDDRFTAPIHGFQDAEDYWRRASSKQFLHRIQVPTLLINARNDSFLTRESLPFEQAEQSAFVFLEASASGGHVGFRNGLINLRPWYEQRAVEFLQAVSA
jgi:predicted alpha/beta-fold hydrolase